MARIVKDWTKDIALKETKAYVKGIDNKSIVIKTTDRISLPNKEDILLLHPRDCKKTCTDFAVYNEVSYGAGCVRDKTTGEYWLNSSSLEGIENEFVDGTGFVNSDAVQVPSFGLCPSLIISLPNSMTLKEIEKDIGEIRKVESTDEQKGYLTIDLGEYPKTEVSDVLRQDLNTMFNNGNLSNQLKCTGRLWTVNGNDYAYENFLSKQIPEFEYKGERYVLFHGYNNRWIKVEPVTFKILNSDKLIKGKVNELKLESEEIVLAGLPYYPYVSQENCALWQNSLVRAFLNSANSSDLDGETEYQAELKWDFRNSGFLYQALNMTREPTRVYTIPEAENKIADYAFVGCVGIEKIVVPKHVKEIGTNPFYQCVNTQIEIESLGEHFHFSSNDIIYLNIKFIYISKHDKSIILSPYEDKSLDRDYIKQECKCQDSYKYSSIYYRENLVKVTQWYEDRKIKFIPPEYTLLTFPSDQIDKYFVNNNNKRWGKLVKTLGFDMLEGIEKNNSLVDLMKIYYAIGGFSENQGESEKAYGYILKHVAVPLNALDSSQKPFLNHAKLIGSQIHDKFSRLNLKGAYNPNFAKFFMKYYHENNDFMRFELKNEYDELMEEQDYLCQAHNAFDLITKSYPNRVVNGNEERALLTPRFVAEHCQIVEYEYVDEGNEILAEIVGKYGYSQDQFDHIQDVYNKAKSIKEKYVIQADKSKEKNGVSFRILEKDDPIGFVLGDITNCCQHIGGAGESCVDDGYTNPNAGFLVFEESICDEKGEPTDEKRILAQAYIWYDPNTKTVCYDNIEIPTKVLDELRKGEKHGGKLSSKTLLDSLVSSADAIMSAMNKEDVKVKRVTTGQGYNDLIKDLEKKFGKAEKNPKARHRNYNGYSDALEAQYVIRTYDETTKIYANTIRDTAKIIQNDLYEISDIVYCDQEL